MINSDMAALERREPGMSLVRRVHVLNPSSQEIHTIFQAQRPRPEKAVTLVWDQGATTVKLLPHNHTEEDLVNIVTLLPPVEGIVVEGEQSPPMSLVNNEKSSKLKIIYMRGHFAPDEAADLLDDTSVVPHLRLTCYEEASNGEGLFPTFDGIPFDLYSSENHHALANFHSQIQRAEFVGLEIAEPSK